MTGLAKDFAGSRRILRRNGTASLLLGVCDPVIGVMKQGIGPGATIKQAGAVQPWPDSGGGSALIPLIRVMDVVHKFKEPLVRYPQFNNAAPRVKLIDRHTESTPIKYASCWHEGGL